VLSAVTQPAVTLPCSARPRLALCTCRCGRKGQSGTARLRLASPPTSAHASAHARQRTRVSAHHPQQPTAQTVMGPLRFTSSSTITTHMAAAHHCSTPSQFHTLRTRRMQVMRTLTHPRRPDEACQSWPLYSRALNSRDKRETLYATPLETDGGSTHHRPATEGAHNHTSISLLVVGTHRPSIELEVVAEQQPREPLSTAKIWNGSAGEAPSISSKGRAGGGGRSFTSLVNRRAPCAHQTHAYA